MTTERKAQISARIIAEIGKGKSLQEAIDTVLGEGRYAQIASDLYEALRA